ncbi:MAG: ATP-binding protein [Bacteroidota bacterium]
MQETTTPTSLPLDGLHLLESLMDTRDFRKKIPTSLQGFAKLSGAARAFLLELLPLPENESKFQYQRILEVNTRGEQTEHNVPRRLVNQTPSFSPLVKWMMETSTVGITDAEPPSGLPLLIQAASREAEVYSALRDNKICHALIKAVGLDFSSFMLFPLIHQNQLWGVVFLCSPNKHEWPHSSQRYGITFSKLLARLLSQDFQTQRSRIRKRTDRINSNKFYPVNKHTSPLAEAREKLTEQDFIQVLVTTIPACLFVVDLEYNKVIFSNQDTFAGYNFMTANSPLELFASIIHPDQRQTGLDNFFERFRQATDNEIVESEYCIRHNDGHWIWVQERVRVFQRFPDGKVRQYLTALEDITEKKQNLLKLKKSQLRYQNFIKYSAEGMFFVNCGEPIPTHLSTEEQTEMFYANAYIGECNTAIARMYGLEKVDDLVGKRIEDIHQGEHYEHNRQTFSTFAEGGYKSAGRETMEEDVQGNLHYFAHHATGLFEDGCLVGLWGVQRDITETRLAEQALRETESKLSSFIQDAQMGIWEWDWQTDQVEVNTIFLGILGLDESVSSFTKEEFVALIAEPYRTRLHHAMTSHLENNTENYQVEIQMGNSPSTMRWFQLHGRKVEVKEDGSPKRLIGSLINVHENKVAELLLQEGEALLRAVVEAIPDTKLRVNKQGKILAAYTTQKGKSIYLNLRRDLIVGQQLDKVFPFAVATGLSFNAKSALEHGILQTFEFTDNLAGEETRRYYEARINAINQDEYILILRDVSAIKQAQQALTEQVREVDRKNRELEAYIKSNLQLENFAYIASHDLREPARTMRTFSQFLKKRAGDQLDKDSQMYLDFIITGADRMNQLIQDLLKYSRVNSEPFEREFIAPVSLLKEILTQLKSSIQEKQAEIVIGELPAKIQGSATRLRQLFQNLISNSIKFHQPDKPPKIEILAQETPTHWHFTIIDNGIGIDPQFHEQVFVIFKKLHNNQAYEGTGIGLALVKRIVTQHEGEVWLDSQLGEGTSIHFTLRK